MSELVKLSIIIPHYNSPEMLNLLLKTIPINSQIQVIVVDDLSNLRLNEYKNLKRMYENVLFLNNTSGIKGAGACRNIGLDIAKGEWILFADSDDYFLEGFYEELTYYFNADYDVVFFTPTSYDLEKKMKSDRHEKYEELIDDYIEKRDSDSEMKLRYKYHVPWSKLIRKKFLNNYNIRFDQVVASNDVMFSTKVGHNVKEFDVTKTTIYCVTRSKGSLTRNISTTVFDARLMVHINYCNFLKQVINKIKWNNFRLDGRSFIISAIKQKYGVKKIVWTIYILNKNKIEIVNLKFLNPFLLMKLVRKINRDFKENSKYFVS